MSDYKFDRPSKRRRRDSYSSSSNGDNERIDQGKEYRYRERSPRTKEDRRRRFQDEGRTSNHRRRERSNSYDTSRRDSHKGELRHRSRSRSRQRDKNTDLHSSRDRHRSYYPRSGDRKQTRNREDNKSNHHSDKHRRSRSRSPRPHARSKAPLPSQNDAFTATSDPLSALDKPLEKEKPNFGVTGKLATASNTIQTANQTIVLKYHEPSEARKPPARDQWRLYVFKGEEITDTVELAEQSCWLIGREVAVADLPIEHPSCSKQHAVIQFRHLRKKNEFGDKIEKVKPYVLDLESANGTILNGDTIPAAKYVELRDKDVLKFGQSSREYVIQLPPTK